MRMLYVLSILFATSMAQARQESVSNIIRSQLLEYFTPYVNSSEYQQKQVLGQLLDTQTQTQLAYPPFPRTWLEVSRSEPYETTTTATFDSSKMITALEVFAGPLSNIAKSALNAVQPTVRRDVSIKYAYNYKTTFMAMSSLRPINPKATQNSNESIAIPPSEPESALRSVLRWDPEVRRTYFNSSETYPVIGLCKYELSLTIEETDSRTLSFIFGSDSAARKIVNDMSYSVFSNFFIVEPHVPVQEYLRTRCGDNFTEAVRFLAEEDFSNLVKETFSHYHPQAQCEWTPEKTADPRGDASCMAWYNNPRYVMGSYRRITVPRCVIGSAGIPVCVLRSKKGTQCPIYEYMGRLTEDPPIDGGRQMNPSDASLFRCDKGYQCMPEDGTKPSQYSIGNNTLERIWTRMTGVPARCQPKSGT